MFGVRFQSFGVWSDTHVEVVGCTFRHTVQHVNDHSRWEPQMFFVGTTNILGGNFEDSRWEFRMFLVGTSNVLGSKGTFGQFQKSKSPNFQLRPN
jgi:hypothetical protein